MTSGAPYPNALVLPHPALTAAQAEHLCREYGFRITQDRRGHLRLSATFLAPGKVAQRIDPNEPEAA